MFKASMLYHRFKNIYLIGDADETLSQEYIDSLQQERESDERQTDGGSGNDTLFLEAPCCWLLHGSLGYLTVIWSVTV